MYTLHTRHYTLSLYLKTQLWYCRFILLSYGILCPQMRSVFFSPGSTQSLPCHTASGDNCTSSICPNTVVTYTCTITSGTAAGYTDWIFSTGTCPTNAFPDKIRLSQLVSGSCTAVVISTCGPYTASSIQSSNPTFCLSSILTVSITAAMNGSTVMCSNTNLITPSITTIVSMTTINVVGMPFICAHVVCVNGFPDPSIAITLQLRCTVYCTSSLLLPLAQLQLSCWYLSDDSNQFIYMVWGVCQSFACCHMMCVHYYPHIK